MTQRLPKLGSTWKHHKGNEYEVYDITNEGAEPENAEQYPVNISYRGANGKKWSKSLANFLAKMTWVRDQDGGEDAQA